VHRNIGVHGWIRCAAADAPGNNASLNPHVVLAGGTYQRTSSISLKPQCPHVGYTNCHGKDTKRNYRSSEGQQLSTEENFIPFI